MMRTILGTLALAGAFATAIAAEPQVIYPEGYRAWRHVKSMVIETGHPLYASFGGIHHIYANSLALEGYRTGRFPDGSVIVFDLLEALRGDNAVTEGGRKVLGVMQKDSRRFATTGGWGFEGFAAGMAGERVVGGNAKAACFDCHTAREANDYVFSANRD
jgi:hypothetical protein